MSFKKTLTHAITLHNFWTSLTEKSTDLEKITVDKKLISAYKIILDAFNKRCKDIRKNKHLTSKNKQKQNTYIAMAEYALFLGQLTPAQPLEINQVHFIYVNQLNLPARNIHNIANHTSDSHFSNQDLSKIIHLFNLVIDFGNNQLIWRFPLLNGPQKIEKKKNPLGTKEEWQQALYSAELYQRHKSFIQTIQKKAFDEQTLLGVILIDLIFESFVISQNNLLQLIGQLPGDDNYCFQEGRLFFYVPVDDFNNARRVFLSAQTQSLIYQYAPLGFIKEKANATVLNHKSSIDKDTNGKSGTKSDKKLLRGSLMKCLESYIKILSVPLYLLPSSLFGWCRVAEKGMYLRLPPIMINYYAGTGVSHSLRSDTLNRVFATSIPDTAHSYGINNEEPKVSTKKKTHNTSYALKSVRRIFNKKSRRKDCPMLLQAIKDESDNLGAIPVNIHLIKEWGMFQLSLIGSQRFHISPSKILAKIDSIARHIIGVFEARSLLDTPPELRSMLYLEVIENAVSNRNKNTIQANLRAFNAWLEKHALGQQNTEVGSLPNKEEIFGDPKLTDMSVNSNLVTFDEYWRVKRHLITLIDRSNSIEKEHFEIMLLMLILGFRCGLRSSEVFKLKLNDFVDCDISPQLVIRESFDRELKTSSAKRIFNLTDFLEHEEMAVLKKRVGFVGHKLEILLRAKRTELFEKAYLFCSHESLTSITSIQRIKTPLMQMLRVACKDATITFHHLRHSFASWHFLSGMISEFDLNPKTLFKAYPETDKWLKGAGARKLKLLPTAMKSKKFLFWIAIKMGHENFKTTFEHYVHTADIVSALLQDQIVAGYSSKYLSQATNTSEDTLKRQKEKRGMFAAKYYASKHLKSAIKSQLKNSEYLAFDATMSLPEPAVLTYPTEDWYSTMATYTEIKSITEEFRLSKEQKVVARYFKKYPQLRLRSLHKTEKVSFNQLAENVSETYDITLNEKLSFSTEFKKVMKTILMILTPESSDQQTLKPQRDYKLLTTNIKQAHIVITAIKKLGIPYQLHLEMKNPDTKKGKKQNKDALAYWSKSLKIPLKKLIFHETFLKKTGPHSRLEIRPVKENGNKHHPFFYFWVSVFSKYPSTLPKKIRKVRSKAKNTE